MALAYKDFFPILLESGFFSSKFEDLPTTLVRVNEWMSTSGKQLVTVETLLLPNVSNEKEASESSIRTSGEVSSYWYQVVRVWYLDA